ncbi:cytochrome P450 734A1 [Selaginella moellendorffii]|uniref:cytochrome P450 734A1 n=1 Tax=Selaginella moellendorffii TaxID=88036 RepID=UPI000D1C80B8|nr:cytochrome P450 734A1 [Selaginella moellendorffii]|eukprot:XP_024521687.1 cytochrome P450 734A1 [Selaginella moellendorffii]
MDVISVLLVALVLAFSVLWMVCSFLMRYYWVASALRPVMEKQGIRGSPNPPNPIFDVFYGKPDMKEISHDILPHVLPWAAQHIKFYGNVHLNWWLREPRIVISEPKIIWDLLMKKHKDFVKSHFIKVFSDDIFHKGLFHANGEDWARQRQIVAPRYYIDEVKAMVGAVNNATSQVMAKWEAFVKDSGDVERELDVQVEFMNLNVDVVARTTLGLENSDFQNILKLIPFGINVERWKVRKQFNDLVRKQVRERRKRTTGNNVDFIGMLLDNPDVREDVIVAELKTLYATGFISLAPLLSFTMLMLALYPDWQEKARQEVDQVLDGEVVSPKDIEMILRETLRLYPTMPLIARVCIKDTMLGDVFIPKGLGVSVNVVALHHDRDLWGDDVNEFNPSRFKNGTATAAKHPMAFMPFAYGVRTCIGRAFSEMQCKIIIANILQRFEVKLSPNYRHHPVITGPLIPKHGMPVILKPRRNF